MKKRKWIIWILVMAVIFTVSGFAYNRLSAAYEQNRTEGADTEQKSVNAAKNKADDFTVYDENKEKVKLSDYIGKPLVVNFWASWCPPCKREMPAFQEAVNLYGEKVAFLMVNETDGQRETMDTAQTFFEDNGYNMKILFDSDGNAGSTYNILFLPRTLFIDEDGNIVEDHVGELTETELTDSIKKLLPN